MRHNALWIAVFGFIAMQGVASAETISGKITQVNPQDNSFRLSRTDQAAGDELKIGIEDNTQFSGVQSLDELSIGDDVQVEADQNVLTRAWKASAVLAGEGTSQDQAMGSDPAAGGSEQALQSESGLGVTDAQDEYGGGAGSPREEAGDAGARPEDPSQAAQPQDALTAQPSTTDQPTGSEQGAQQSAQESQQTTGVTP